MNSKGRFAGRKRNGTSEQLGSASRFSLRNQSTQTPADREFHSRLSSLFDSATGSTAEKLESFARFVPRQALSLFIAKHLIFEKVVTVHGSIVECGVFMGSGLFTWAQLSAIHEPVNHGRKVIGFDTFAGFPALSAEDQTPSRGGDFEHKQRGSYCFDAAAELERSAQMFDLNRPLGHIPKIELVKGDAITTIPKYVADNQHLTVALLYLDFDLYEPTKIALQHLRPRMPRGAVLAFDELNQKQWPGETRAVLEEVGISSLRIERFPFTPAISYAVLD